MLKRIPLFLSHENSRPSNIHLDTSNGRFIEQSSYDSTSILRKERGNHGRYSSMTLSSTTLNTHHLPLSLSHGNSRRLTPILDNLRRDFRYSSLNLTSYIGKERGNRKERSQNQLSSTSQITQQIPLLLSLSKQRPIHYIFDLAYGLKTTGRVTLSNFEIQPTPLKEWNHHREFLNSRQTRDRSQIRINCDDRKRVLCRKYSPRSPSVIPPPESP